MGPLSQAKIKQMAPIRSDVHKDKMENALLCLKKSYRIISTRHIFWDRPFNFIFTLHALSFYKQVLSVHLPFGHTGVLLAVRGMDI